MSRRYKRKNANNNTVLLVIIAVLVLFAPYTGGNQTALISLAVLILLLLGCLAGMLFYREYRRRAALHQLELADVDHMSGLGFEQWVAERLRLRGFKIRLTPINDYGVDIVATKADQRIAVQVKRYSKAVDQKSVREAVAGMRQYKCTASMVVTNSRFTKAAQVLARSNNCQLVDRDKLATWLTETVTK